MNIKGKALLAGCIALAFSNMALAEDIKVAVVGAMSGPVAQYGDQDALCVFEYAFELPTIFCEAQNYKSITFVSTRDLDKLDNLDWLRTTE